MKNNITNQTIDREIIAANGVPLIPAPLLKESPSVDTSTGSLDRTLEITPERTETSDIARKKERKPRAPRQNLEDQFALAANQAPSALTEKVPGVAKGIPVSSGPKKTAKEIEEELLAELIQKGRPVYALNPNETQRQLKVYPASVPADVTFDGVDLTSQSVEMFDKTLAVQPVAPYGRFTPLGMAAMLDHYKSTDKMKHKTFECHLYNLTSLVTLAQMHKIETFGVVVVNAQGHAFPVLIHKNKAFVAETLGFGRSIDGAISTLQTVEAIKKAGKFEFHTFKEQVQADSYSCGSFAVKMLNKMMSKLSHLDSLPFNGENKLDIRVSPKADSALKDKEKRAIELFDKSKGDICVHSHFPDILKYTQIGDVFAKRIADLKSITDQKMLKDHFLKDKGDKPNGIMILKPDAIAPGQFVQTLYNMTIDNARDKHAKKIVPERLSVHKASNSGVRGLVAEYTGVYLFVNSQIPAALPVAQPFLEQYKTFIRQEAQIKRCVSADDKTFHLTDNSIRFENLEALSTQRETAPRPA